MTNRDKDDIRMLHAVLRYSQATLARLYGVTEQRIQRIRLEIKVIPLPFDQGCILDGFKPAKQFYIDGNENNDRPQNKIILCETHKRRIEHMHLRKRGSLLTTES